DVSKTAAVFVRAGEIGILKPAIDAWFFDADAEHSEVLAGSRPLESNREIVVVRHDRHISNLHVAEEQHAGRAPVLERVGKDIGVHEWAPGLSRAKVTELSIRMSEAKRRLACVYADAEQFPFECDFQFALGCVDERLDAVACLANAGPCDPVASEFTGKG